MENNGINNCTWTTTHSLYGLVSSTDSVHECSYSATSDHFTCSNRERQIWSRRHDVSLSQQTKAQRQKNQARGHFEVRDRVTLCLGPSSPGWAPHQAVVWLLISPVFSNLDVFPVGLLYTQTQRPTFRPCQGRGALQGVSSARTAPCWALMRPDSPSTGL